MGFTIRHLSTMLERMEARTKLLITLSDGKPEDYDSQYRGQYGIEDINKLPIKVSEIYRKLTS
jgi:nitric oxide reductase NorD protein